MRREDLIRYLPSSDFRPMRICMSDGMTFDLRNPEFLVIEGSTAVILLTGDTSHQHVSDGYHVLVLHHVTRLEPLEDDSLLAG